MAEQLSTNKLRALKIMRPEIAADATMRERFVREAKAGSRITSDHVVEVVTAGVEQETPYLVMELLEGETLGSLVARQGALRPEDALAILRQLFHAVNAAHEGGIVHRDLKPENVFLSRSRLADSKSVVKVLDFGIAKLVAQESAQTTAALGSPVWLAPEQTGPAPVTPATDVWALGLIAFHLITGKVFWRAMDAESPSVAHVMREVLFDPIPRAS